LPFSDARIIRSQQEGKNIGEGAPPDGLISHTRRRGGKPRIVVLDKSSHMWYNGAVRPRRAVDL
jgi:hypothetical protein